ncbi:uncharacterized protein [Procambarus clarkii]|uniref:uncharacterized protein isoform X1 n=1 Tax=Procambarus clarkii TaxID=6728 RepID=UPI00374302EC
MFKIPKPPTVTVVVRNLPAGTTEEHLRSLCENFGGMVEVEIPKRAALFKKFIFGFVRFVSLDAALNAVMKLDGLVVQRRIINAQLARSHWRNTNQNTVLYEEPEEKEGEDEASSSLTEDDLDTTIMHMCHQQWLHHRRTHRNQDLPSFGKIMEILSQLSTSDDEDSETEEVEFSFSEMMLDEPEMKPVEPEMRLSNPGVRFVDPEMKFADTEMRLIDPEIRLADPEMRLPNTGMRYVNPEMRFVDTEMTFAGPATNIRLAEPGMRLPNPGTRLVDPDLKQSSTCISNIAGTKSSHNTY